MAFAAQLAAHAEELITAVTSVDSKSDRTRFSALRESSLRTLRHHNSFARTNQFHVAEQLEGLQEKFVVNGRDGLARELRSRLDRLPGSSPSTSSSFSSSHSAKWIPEILHLLLELSDRPVQESSLAVLEQLWAPLEEDEAEPLRWEDIAKEDGWAEDRALWRNVNFGGDSSEDETALDDGVTSDSGISEESSEATTDPDSSPRLKRILRDPSDRSDALPSLKDVLQSQSWRSEKPQADPSGRPRKIALSEAQVVREVLFMMQGHRTTLFDAKCAPVQTYQLANVSWDVYRALITSVSEAGRPLRVLRDFVDARQEIPLLQTFHDCVRRALRLFDSRVSEIQARYVAPRADVVVSVPAVFNELLRAAGLRPLHALSAVVKRLQDERHPHAFRCLELLFDATCLAQLEGDDETYHSLGPIFLDCFQVYLRPIRLWMEEGQLLPGDRIFFVSQSSLKAPLNQIWQSQFKLRRTHDGALHAPRFLRPAASRIFTTGKSIVVLKHLGRYQRAKAQQNSNTTSGRQGEPSLAFADVCPAGTELAPFSELFGDAFDRWTKSKHHAASATLRRELFDSCGLWTTLDALHHVFLGSDGAAWDSFAAAVFGGVDRMNPRWHDRFTLTEIAQEAFSSAAVADSRRVSAAFNPVSATSFGKTVFTGGSGGAQPQSAEELSKARTSVRASLPLIKLQYRMAWPVQLIIPDESIEKYQTVFTLLMQLRRAVYVLNRHRLLHGNSEEANVVPPAAVGEKGVYFNLRARLLWFCNALLTYLATLVFSPGIASLRQKLEVAEDVDAMMACHAAFIKALVEEACLGPKLTPIRECVLDVLDLAVRLEDARLRDANREADEAREIGRLSVAIMSPSPKKKPRLRGRYVSPIEAEEGGDGDDEVNGDGGGDGADEGTTDVFLGGRSTMRQRQQVPDVKEEQDYSSTLRNISADFDRHLRFITGGLRGVARASADAAAGKWDMLAEMLETGVKDR